MNWLDIVITLIIVAVAAIGIRRGFMRGALDLVTVLVSFLAAAAGYRFGADLITAILGWTNVTVNTVALVLIFVAVHALLTVLIGTTLYPSLYQARADQWARLVDNGLGIVPGIIRGGVLAAAFLVLMTLLPPGANLDDDIAESNVSQSLLARTSEFMTWTQDVTGLNLTDFTVIVPRVQPDVTYELPFTVEAGLQPNQEDEDEMLRLLNDERIQRGLEPLAFDPELRDVAREHSEEMFRLGYFSHISPETGGPGDRLLDAGVTFQIAGENLAYGPNVRIAHRGLMNSEGHRANILSPEFTRVGIGVIESPDRGRMYTQKFAAP